MAETKHSTLSEKLAYKLYEKLKSRLEKVIFFGEHYALLLTPATRVLDFFPIDESSDETNKATIPNRDDILIHIAVVSVPSDSWFESSKIGRYILAIRIMSEIAFL